jgi:hypothetical protein
MLSKEVMDGYVAKSVEEKPISCDKRENFSFPDPNGPMHYEMKKLQLFLPTISSNFALEKPVRSDGPQFGEKVAVSLPRDGDFTIEQPPTVINVSRILEGDLTDFVNQYEKVCNCIAINKN